MEFDATFLFASISFIIFVILMNKIFYAPILKIMKEREDFVSQNYSDAENLKSKTQENIKSRNEQLQKSREEAQEIIAKQSKNLKQERSREIAEYKEELFGNIAKQKEELKNSAYSAKDVLKDKVVDIAQDISVKLFGGSIDSSLIDKSDINEN